MFDCRLRSSRNPRPSGLSRSSIVPRLLLATALLAAIGGNSGADEASPERRHEQVWGLLVQLAGTWEGEIDGKLGQGRGIRRYEPIMGGKYLVVRHRSVRLPQEKSPAGDRHEELAVFSIDRERQAVVLREFMIEGVVVRSLCELIDRKVVCASETVESGPGIRARLSLEIDDAYRFTETYELGWPDKELEHYFSNRWTRVPALSP